MTCKDCIHGELCNRICESTVRVSGCDDCGFYSCETYDEAEKCEYFKDKSRYKIIDEVEDATKAV